MNYKIFPVKRFSAWAVIALGCIFLFNFAIAAQTSRRTQPTPTPEQNSPQIISRADDFVESRQIVVPENSTENADILTEKIDKFNSRMNEIGERLNNLETNPTNQFNEKQRRLLLNLDILSRSEQRAENLRKQLFEMTEKEGEIRSRLDQIEYNLRPEAINSMVAVAGTLRPEELRQMRRGSLEREKTNLQNLLVEIERNKQNLEFNVQKADALVDKLRLKLEKEIDDALNEDSPQ